MTTRTGDSITCVRALRENTLPAFQRALDKNCGIELDIHLTRDGELVVFHDDNLVRACDSSLKVDESTLKELQSHTLFDTDQTMPLFSEVLSLVDGKVPLLIELKTDNNVMSKRYMKVCQKLKEELEGYNGTYAIQSFRSESALVVSPELPGGSQRPAHGEFPKTWHEGGSDL